MRKLDPVEIENFLTDLELMEGGNIRRIEGDFGDYEFVMYRVGEIIRIDLKKPKEADK